MNKILGLSDWKIRLGKVGNYNEFLEVGGQPGFLKRRRFFDMPGPSQAQQGIVLLKASWWNRVLRSQLLEHGP